MHRFSRTQTLKRVRDGMRHNLGSDWLMSDFSVNVVGDREFPRCRLCRATPKEITHFHIFQEVGSILWSLVLNLCKYYAILQSIDDRVRSSTNRQRWILFRYRPCFRSQLPGITNIKNVIHFWSLLVHLHTHTHTHGLATTWWHTHVPCRTRVHDGKGEIGNHF